MKNYQKESVNMKKIVSFLLVMLITVFATVSTSALDSKPISFEEYVYRYFRDFYSTVEDVVTVAGNADYKLILIDDPYDLDRNDYAIVRYTSNNPILEPYFHRFGENDEYYECSDVTNLLFESGITVFCGKYLSFPESHNDDFYTVEEILEIQPKAFDKILEYLGPECVGIIGDADGDRAITIIDATEIQRHIAELSVIANEKIVDFDNSGKTDILDATSIQLKLAQLQ